MYPSRGFRLVPVAVMLLAGTASAYAQGRVQLELIVEDRVPLTGRQEWLRRLGEAGITDFRIRSGPARDRVGIDVRGTEAAPTYVVTGMITASDQLVVPGQRFGARDLRALAQWLDELARLGPPDQRPKKTAFGLDVNQFQRVHEDLARKVGFSTTGMSRREVAERIGRQLTALPEIDPRQLRAMEQETVAEELSGLSCGTALAYAVRPMGLCVVPRASGGGAVGCAIVPATPNLKAWPVGWEPDKPARDVLPDMFEFLNANVQGATVSRVLEAVGQRLKVPVLLDHNALARHGVEPGKVTVNLTPSRTTYSLLLRKVCFQARLKSEVRVDEAGNPFLWVTTIKPI